MTLSGALSLGTLSCQVDKTSCWSAQTTLNVNALRYVNTGTIRAGHRLRVNYLDLELAEHRYFDLI